MRIGGFDAVIAFFQEFCVFGGFAGKFPEIGFIDNFPVSNPVLVAVYSNGKIILPVGHVFYKGGTPPWLISGKNRQDGDSVFPGGFDDGIPF